jgi:RimJ/RimL family protein N-acetyltransferase
LPTTSTEATRHEEPCSRLLVGVTFVTLGLGTMTESLLLTERLLFRPFRETDLDDLTALYGDAEVMRFLGEGRPLDRERLDRMLRHWQEHGFGIWALFDKEGGFVGRCGVAYLHRNSSTPWPGDSGGKVWPPRLPGPWCGTPSRC